MQQCNLSRGGDFATASARGLSKFAGNVTDIKIQIFNSTIDSIVIPAMTFSTDRISRGGKYSSAAVDAEIHRQAVAVE